MNHPNLSEIYFSINVQCITSVDLLMCRNVEFGISNITVFFCKYRFDSSGKGAILPLNKTLRIFFGLLFTEKINFLLVNQEKISQLKLVVRSWKKVNKYYVILEVQNSKFRHISKSMDVTHWTFLMTSVFETLYFLKSCPIFDKCHSLYSQNTIIFFEYVDFWAKILAF